MFWGRRSYVILWIIGFLLFFHFPMSNAQVTGPGVQDVRIIAGSGGSDYTVGNAFHCNITLANIGNQTVNSNFTISVYNPSRDLLGARVYARSILPGQATYLFPSKQNPVVPGRAEYDVFFFDSVGSYKLAIVSSQSLFFYRYSEAEYTYSQNSLNSFTLSRQRSSHWA